MKEFFNVRLRSIRSSRVNSDFLEVGYSSRFHVVCLPCFGIPLSLKTALVIRALLLITGGWTLISNFGDIINIVFTR